MKMTCDLCGCELQMNPVGAVCPNCGLEYGADRIKEKTAQQKVAVNQTSVRERVKKPTAEKSKAQKKMTVMWIILALIGVVAFVGGLMESGILYVICLVALLITLFVFKPWNVYGGKAI